jgi:hypothetical protein
MELLCTIFLTHDVPSRKSRFVCIVGLIVLIDCRKIVHAALRYNQQINQRAN